MPHFGMQNNDQIWPQNDLGWPDHFFLFGSTLSSSNPTRIQLPWISFPRAGKWNKIQSRLPVELSRIFEPGAHCRHFGSHLFVKCHQEPSSSPALLRILHKMREHMVFSGIWAVLFDLMKNDWIFCLLRICMYICILRQVYIHCPFITTYSCWLLYLWLNAPINCPKDHSKDFLRL